MASAVPLLLLGGALLLLGGKKKKPSGACPKSPRIDTINLSMTAVELSPEKAQELVPGATEPVEVDVPKVVYDAYMKGDRDITVLAGKVFQTRVPANCLATSHVVLTMHGFDENTGAWAPVEAKYYGPEAFYRYGYDLSETLYSAGLFSDGQLKNAHKELDIWWGRIAPTTARPVIEDY